MPLVSNLFRDNKRLQECLVSDPAHITPGSVGEHVRLIQLALVDLDGLSIDAEDLSTHRYGPSTAAAVLAFKKKRSIINRSYQSTEDNIVGKMTIAALDTEMVAGQHTPVPGDKRCGRVGPVTIARLRPPAPVGKRFDIA
jgi:peptidoglycan hydrolase-like protein with peptidoglycan-binding domain